MLLLTQFQFSVDQAKAIGNAITLVLPKAEHRWCKWHVLKRAHELLANMYQNHKTFADDFHKLVNHMPTSEEFENAWMMVTEWYGLQKDPFMAHAYECRHKWDKPYFSVVFHARMCSAQCSESAKHVLKIYISCNSSLNGFVTWYTKQIDDRKCADAAA